MIEPTALQVTDLRSCIPQLARWEYAEDRFNLYRWLAATPPSKAVRYSCVEDVSWGPVVRIKMRAEGTRAELCYDLKLYDVLAAKNWRQMIAAVLREMRQFARHGECG